MNKIKIFKTSSYDQLLRTITAREATPHLQVFFELNCVCLFLWLLQFTVEIIAFLNV